MKILILVITLLTLLVYKPIKAQEDEITAGIAAGSAIADALSEVDFKKVLKSIVGMASSFLGTLGPIVDLVMAFIPDGDSAELTYMREQFSAVNNKLDAMSQQFTALSNKIDWGVMQIIYRADENRIKNMLIELDEFVSAPNKEAAKDEKYTFIRNYENSFQNAAQNLYSVLTRSDSALTPNLIEAACKHLGNNRKEVQVFMMGIVQLLVEGAEIDVMYYKLKKKLDETNQKTIWNTRIEEVQQRMTETDDKLKDLWNTQSKIDILKYSSEHYSEDRQTFANGLQQFLTSKYYWRYWDVIVYDQIAEDKTDDYYGMQCPDTIFYQFEQYSMTVVVSSREVEQRRTISPSAVQSILDTIQSTWQGHTISYWKTVQAKKILNSISSSVRSCTGSYSFIGVLKPELNVKIAGGNSVKKNLTFRKTAQTRIYTFIFFA